MGKVCSCINERKRLETDVMLTEGIQNCSSLAMNNQESIPVVQQAARGYLTRKQVLMLQAPKSADTKSEESLEVVKESLKEESIASVGKNTEQPRSGYRLYSDGSSYFGEFQNGLRHGFGKMHYSNKDYYEGEFFQDLRHGKGKILLRNNTSYYGDWANDAIEGKGVLRMNDGIVYIGFFIDGQLHGKGKVKHTNGTIIEGEWDKGNLVDE